MTQPPADTPAPLSGFQFRIHSGEHQATITDVGAKVRSYAVGGRNVFTPFGADQVAPTGHGALLAPWPNRLRYGRDAYAGTEYQVDISEPPTHTALHGLVMWQCWQVVAVDDAAHADGAAVTLELRLAPSDGYPFDLHLVVTYRLGADGLRVTARATNLGSQTAPYGIGFHPWLCPGDASLDACTVPPAGTTSGPPVLPGASTWTTPTWTCCATTTACPGRCWAVRTAGLPRCGWMRRWTPGRSAPATTSPPRTSAPASRPSR